MQAAFRDPASPFYLEPGTQGPASPSHPHEEQPLSTTARNSDPFTDSLEPIWAAHQELLNGGFDPKSFWEQTIVWGDQDAFQYVYPIQRLGGSGVYDVCRHVNNVRYSTFFLAAFCVLRLTGP